MSLFSNTSDYSNHLCVMNLRERIQARSPLLRRRTVGLSPGPSLTRSEPPQSAAVHEFVSDLSIVVSRDQTVVKVQTVILEIAVTGGFSSDTFS